MKNITFSAHEDAIEKARKVAIQQRSTLNEMFREWLEHINKEQAVDANVADRLDALWKRTSYLRVGKKFSRYETHER